VGEPVKPSVVPPEIADVRGPCRRRLPGFLVEAAEVGRAANGAEEH
jgi:hypothetical protein